MIEVVVLSGKGGTGKTSLTAAFAYLAGSCVIADCDVDAPNLHLLAAPEVDNEGEFISGKAARILPERCTGCGTCLELCRFDAVRASNGVAGPFHIEPTDCEGCGVCFYFCPERAVVLDEPVAGRWYTSRSRFGPMAHATLSARGENSGKLVTLIREKARALAAARNIELILIDGPPGIGCPVIASLVDTRFVVVVTEPTVSGKHDLDRVVKLMRHFKINGGVCINRADVNEDEAARIATWCRAQGVPLLGKIPYDRAFAQAVAEGKCVPEFTSGRAARAVRTLWAAAARLAAGA